MKPTSLVSLSLAAALFLGACGGGDEHAAAEEAKKAKTTKTTKKPIKKEEAAATTPENLRPNVETEFNEDVETPFKAKTAYIDPMASVIGNVDLGDSVYVAPFASIRGDEGQPIHIGDNTNVQDGVVIHALEVVDEKGELRKDRVYEVDEKPYAVYIGDKVSLAHQSQVHGPARIGNEVFVGMQALVFKSEIGAGSVIEPAAKVIGVKVAPKHYVKAGSVITTQAEADKLPEITDSYAYKNLNSAVVKVNTSFAEGYAKQEGTKAKGEDGDTKPSKTKSKTSEEEPSKTKEKPKATTEDKEK